LIARSTDRDADPRPGVVVCVAGGGADELRARTLASLRAHTSGDVPVLEQLEKPLLATARAAADLVVIEPGCVVAAGWLDALREVARSATTIATATALTQHDLGDWTDHDALEQAAAALRARSPRLRPRIPPGGGACVYVRRSAIELVGGEPGFEQRCVERGLAHVLADNVLVLDRRPAEARPDRRPGQAGQAHARALAAARRALHGLRVTIDARILGGPMTGTQVHVLEVIAALARLERLHLAVVVPDDPSPGAMARLEALPGIALLSYEQASRACAHGPIADVVHRPFQLSNAGDLTFLASVGERLVLTQQDLIAYHNPAYFPSRAGWEAYRRLTRLALGAADRVLFFSAHARDDALAEDLLAPARAGVVHLGVDHPGSGQAGGQPPAPPAGAERLAGGAPAMLCLGTDYHHKNRLFALRLLGSLRRDHAWRGVLVLAGPNVAHGSSRSQEAEMLARHPELAGAVVDVGPVSEAEKDWLFDRAALVVYPSAVEGFGLVPFEAAAHRVPCLWAPGSSLSELLPDQAAGLVPWDEARSAERALALLTDEGARAGNLDAIDRAAAPLTWDATAAGLLAAYQATADAPAVSATHVAAPGGLHLLTEDAARLVGPGGELPADVHRPLLALATHPRIARPVFAALKLGYRISYELRRRRRAQRRR
jgi:glycosyltransferase involved in cell wall biosynthesis